MGYVARHVAPGGEPIGQLTVSMGPPSPLGWATLRVHLTDGSYADVAWTGPDPDPSGIDWQAVAAAVIRT